MSARRPSPPANNKRAFLRRYMLPLIVGVVVIAGLAVFIGFKVHKEQAIAADKVRFAQAERDIDEISAAIVTKLGAPVKTTSDKYCSRPNMKFDEGRLSCYVTAVHFYSASDEFDATTKANTVSALLHKKWIGVTKISIPKTYSPIKKEGYKASLDYQSIKEDFKTSSLLPCNSSYDYYLSNAAPFNDYAEIRSTPFSIALSVECSVETKQPIYLIRNK